MKRGTPKHPKVYDLCEALKIGRPAVLGYLELLWHFTAEFCPQGDVGRFSDRRIEAAVDWHGKAGRLVSALVQTKWLDTDAKCRLLVHDWADHADEATRKRLARHSLQFHTCTTELTNELPVSDGISAALNADNGSLPLPEPRPRPRPRPEGGRVPATDLNGQTSMRFEEWFAVWQAVRGNAHRTAACGAYTSVVCTSLETDAFDCAASYVQGPGADPHHGYRPDNFLFEMARDNFRTRWPPAQRQEKSRIDWEAI